MDTLTRVLARHVYNLDLHDLPLERMSEQKHKKRGMKFPGEFMWFLHKHIHIQVFLGS